MSPVPPTMTAVRFRPPAGGAPAQPADVVLGEEPVPQLRTGEVLVRVSAAGMNAADLMQRAGHYPPPPGVTEIPGLEVAGTIAAVGPGVERWHPGDSVCALLAGGGYAEYVAVDARQVLPPPAGASAVQAAGLVEVAATVWANLVMHAGMTSGDHLLVHGGTGGIGQFAIQLALSLGAHLMATSGSAEKAATTQRLGARAINYRTEDFVERVHALTDGHGADVILDPVGGRYLDDNVRALATGGRLVIIGTQGGAEGPLNVMRLMRKRAWITGTTLRSRTSAQKQEVLAQVQQHVWPLIADGRISPAEPETFRLADAETAFRRFQDPARTGKVVLTV